MKLIRGATYTNKVSDLAMRVVSIYYESDTVVKIRGVLFNKHNGIVYETKQFDLTKESIKNWEFFKK